MPYKVIFRKDKTGRPYKIVRDRRVVGTSETAEKAKASIVHREQAEKK